MVQILQIRNSIAYYICYNYISATAPSTISKISLAIIVKGMQQVLFVNWTTPQSDVAIFQYHVQYTNETLSWTNASTSAVFAILTGVNADTNYSVRVRAVSAVGNGSWSKVQTVRTYNCE